MKRIKSSFFNVFIAGILSIPLICYPQNLPLEVKLNAGLLDVIGKGRMNDNPGFNDFSLDFKDFQKNGFNFGAEFRLKLNSNFKWLFQLDYDAVKLSQDNVLDEWDWKYWEENYVENLPGIDADSLNKTLYYESSDGVYKAYFNPQQRLKELQFATGLSASFRITEKIRSGISLAAGVSLYTRELRMRENWTKHFVFDTLGNSDSEYDYKFNLLHFAPSKKGSRIFFAPSLDVQYEITQSTAIELNYKYIGYIARRNVKEIENLFKFSKGSDRNFPLESKFRLQLGIVFKY